MAPMQLGLVASITHKATTQEAPPWLGLAECKETAPQEQHSGHSPRAACRSNEVSKDTVESAGMHRAWPSRAVQWAPFCWH